MTDKFKKGDEVEWQSQGTTVVGKVVKKITEDFKLAGHQGRAFKDNPQYLVKSNKAGHEAAYKPEALTKK